MIQSSNVTAHYSRNDLTMRLAALREAGLDRKQLSSEILRRSTNSTRAASPPW